MKILVVNPNTLYDLYETTEKTDAPDLATVGMAMFLKERPDISKEESQILREFVGRHGQALGKVYEDETKTEQDFVQKVAELIIEDIQEAKEHQEDEDAEEGGEA